MFNELDKIEPTFTMADRPVAWQAAQVGRVLNVMFPHSYIEQYHRPPHSVCSIFKTKTASEMASESADECRFEASSEPTARAQVVQLQQQLQDSLAVHQAKPVGLCPVRRAIYDQCFGRCKPLEASAWQCCE